MALQRYAIVDTTTNLVVNVVEYETAPTGPPPGMGKNMLAVQSDQANAGWSYSNGTLAAPPSPPSPPVIPAAITFSQAMRQLDAMGKLSAALSAAQGAGGLTAQLWYSPAWHYDDFQVKPFSDLAAGLGIDPAAFFTAAAKIVS